MNILAINGSPRKKNSNTDRLLLPFIEGARDEGAEVELLYLQGKKIKPCLGCFDCWLKTPGVCAQKDDMAGVLDMLREADVVVLATPLYVCGMSAQMKAMLDRIIPLAEPYIEIRDGQCTHPERDGSKNSSIVLISNCGFHEMHHFNELVLHIKSFARLGGRKFLGALLRPHGEILQIMEQFAPDKVKPVYQAAKDAGRYAARDQMIPEEVLERVAGELMPRDDYIKSANAYFQGEIEKASQRA
jgi:multimeric flavodoxin WrbA